MKFSRHTDIRMLVCIGLFSICGTMAAQAGPTVTVTLLNGTNRMGELQTLAADQLVMNTDRGAEQIPTDTVMQVEFSPAEGDVVDSQMIGATFADRSTLLLSSFESDGTNATLMTPEISELSAPIRQISDVRFSPLDDKIAARWEDLRSRNARDDLLVIRKGDVLDYVAGSIGKVTSSAITILVREKELSAPREKVFGLVFASRPAPRQMRRIAVQTGTGSSLQAETLLLDGEQLQVTLASLGKVTLPLSGVQTLDYGGGRIRYLADLPFDQSGSKAPHENDPVVWFVCRNAPSGTGGKAPLLIGTREFRKGLWLHSGAVLRFRLNREFTQLRAIAGFDLTHVTRMPRFDPRVRLVISGDGKELYAKEYLWSDSPQQLDISLADVRELTIRVDSLGTGQGILEHFALGDAQVIQ